MLYAENARLRQWLTHDTLTGALSRHFFEELAADQLAQARALGRSAPLLMLDHLKTVNDSLGHAAGDALLVDFVGAFLADTYSATALRTAERISRAFAATAPAVTVAWCAASVWAWPAGPRRARITRACWHGSTRHCTSPSAVAAAAPMPAEPLQPPA